MSTISAANSTLPDTYYLKKYYSLNRNARNSSSRKEMTNSELLSYDTSAINSFYKDIKKFKITNSDSETNLKNKVKAFVSVYNNFIKSASKSEDHYTVAKASKLKNLTKDQKKELEKLGITIKRDSSLELDKDKFKASDIKKVEELFSDKSDYINTTSRITKRIDITV